LASLVRPACDGGQVRTPGTGNWLAFCSLWRVWSITGGRFGSIAAGGFATATGGGFQQNTHLVLAIITSRAHQERLVALATLALKTDSIDLALPLDILFVEPDEPLPEICHAGIQFYGS